MNTPKKEGPPEVAPRQAQKQSDQFKDTMRGCCRVHLLQSAHLSAALDRLTSEVQKLAAERQAYEAVLAYTLAQTSRVFLEKSIREMLEDAEREQARKSDKRFGGGFNLQQEVAK